MVEKYAELINEEQAGVILNVSSRTLQAWRCQGNGPKFVKVGRAVRYRMEDLQEYVNKNVRRSTSVPFRTLGSCV